jgi:NADH-quinone oxidoreductase subunit K
MNLTGCLVLSGALFALGAFGMLTRRNMIAALLSLELMVVAALINFVAFARFGTTASAGGDPHAGSVFVFFAVAATAAEMALALAIVIALRRRRHSLDVTELDGLHG